MNNYTQLHNGDYYTSEYYHIYKYIINKYKRAHIMWPLPKEIIFKPLMTENELKNFLYFMKPGNIYFEFGSGGSTNIASFYNLKTYSVESDANWHKKLKNTGIIANYITIDLHATSLGYPSKETNVNDWKIYIQAYKKEYNADIILIDGRFRVACALDIFAKIRNDTVVLLHECGRKQYDEIGNYYDKIYTWRNLCLFQKKKNVKEVPMVVQEKYWKILI